MDQNNYDSALLARLRESDKEAFTKLYDLYSERLYHNLIKLVKSEEIAEEILQDIFILIWEKRETIEIQQSFTSYLFRIGQNKVVDFYRKLRRDRNLYAQVKAIASEEYTHIEEALLNKENAALLKQAMEALPPQRKQVFELCKIEGKSYNDVSKLLGISTSTINDHIVKATKFIRDFIASNRKYSQGLILFLILNGIK